MCFDDPIFLTHDSFDDLMADTEQNRICWMYHDTLSQARIARMFAGYAAQGMPVGEDWTVMAWVAAGRQDSSFYLLFKWYADFYGPPERGDLYYIEQEYGFDREIRVRPVRMDFLQELGDRGRDWLDALWNQISSNATDFFGESDFDSNAVGAILRLLEDNPGRELEAFDWYFGKGSDWEKAVQCATVAAYFASLQAVKEIIYDIVVTDGREQGSHPMHTGELLEILNRLSEAADRPGLLGLVEDFRSLSYGFCSEPARGPVLSRNAVRSLSTLTEAGRIRWVRLGGQGRRKFLRELYCRSDPRRVWDVFHRWQGELYFLVFQSPVIRGIGRGVYVLSRFEDQRGMDVTDLFLLENISGGSVRLCEGAFLGELLDLLLAHHTREISLHSGRRRSDDLTATFVNLLKEAYDKLERGITQRRTSDRDIIY